jgi:hypothetical protein
MNIVAVIIAFIFTILAIRSQIKMREIETQLKFQTFKHHNWDLENPIKNLNWSSPGEPMEVRESRILENSLRQARDNHYGNCGVFSGIAILAWITSFGF